MSAGVHTTESVEEIARAGLDAHQRGDLLLATARYDQALSINPTYADVLHMRGVIAYVSGQPDLACELIERAQRAGLEGDSVRFNLGLALHAQRIKQAAEVFKIKLGTKAGVSSDFLSPEEVGLLAFFLPQFHAIAENNTWWGEGFTEWTNVRKATPNYVGHHQPKVPGELGYYNLLDPAVRQRQAELARAHGVTGFCYYHYWFKGRRLLEQPLDAILKLGQPDFPFCVFWANENWSKRWDGGNQELLMQQSHDEADDIAFIEHLLPFFADKRYIRIKGRPLLLIYRFDLFPNPIRTTQVWRALCESKGEAAPYIVKADAFQSLTPDVYGADAAVEFPPHRVDAGLMKADDVVGLRADYAGHLIRYSDVAIAQSCSDEPPFRQFRTVMPSWDNTARRQVDGKTFVGSTPAIFEAWLRDAFMRAKQTSPAGERIVFVNAWNEWAEGAYLEPDQMHGRAYLEAAQRARYVDRDYRLLSDHDLTPDAIKNKKHALESMLGGWNAYRAGNLVEAANAYKAALNLTPSNGQLHAALGRLAITQGDTLAAAKHLEAACEAARWTSPVMQAAFARTLVELAVVTPQTRIAERATELSQLRESASGKKAMLPLVSVIVPSYNHAKFVRSALESVYAQSYRNIELIVIDDGSSDGSVDVLRASLALCPFPHQLLARENRGANATINQGLTLAKGEYVNVLNSDDLFAPDRIARFVSELTATGAQWGFSACRIIDSDGTTLSTESGDAAPLIALGDIARFAHSRSNGHSPSLLRGNTTISTGNLFFAAALGRKLGGFQSLRYTHDWEFALRAIRLDEPAFIDDALYDYRLHGNNTINEASAEKNTESVPFLRNYFELTSQDAPTNPRALSPQRDGLHFAAMRTSQFADASPPQMKEMLRHLQSLISELGLAPG